MASTQRTSPPFAQNHLFSNKELIYQKDQSHVMQTHPYSKMFRRNRNVTMFDKIYQPASRKPSNRITKRQIRRRPFNEIERCAGMKEKEQYRQLLELYRSKTLAETQLIFCKEQQSFGMSSDDHRKHNSTPPVIDLTESTLSTSHQKMKKAPLIMRKPENAVANSSVSSPNVLPKHAELSFRIETCHAKENQPASSSITNSSIVSTPASSAVPAVDWFSPSSPYLCKAFIPNLLKTHSRRARDLERNIAEEKTRARLLRERRESKEEKLSELLEERLKVVEEVIPDLSEDAKKEVENALGAYPEHQVLVERFNISITRQHMSTLEGLNWLNDEVINFYMELIVERSNSNENLPSAHAMNTFFYPKLTKQGYKSVRRWTKRVDVFSKSLLFFPVHLGLHWTLAVADLRSKELRYYDSMGSPNQECLNALKDYLASEHLDKKKTTYDVSDWKLINLPPKEIPQQMNGSDCGAFACTFAEFVSRDAPLRFSQNDMPLLRRTMVWEILNTSLTR